VEAVYVLAVGHLTPPAASFTGTTNGLTAPFDAGRSSDPGGGIVSDGLDCGDGNSGVGVPPAHE